MTRVFYDQDVPPDALTGETVAVLGYGIQGRAQAHNLRDSGVTVVVGNRDDEFRSQAVEDGFLVLELDQAAARATLLLMLVPDEAQADVFREQVSPGLNPGDGLVFAHGYAVRYGLISAPAGIDVMLCAPRMPGQYVRGRYLEGWGVPAFVGVEQDATGRAWPRLLGLAGAAGFTRCAAIEATFAQETELDHFSEHFTYPLIFRALELAFETLVGAGYPPEVALMELHGSGELGEVLMAASREGLYGMLESHASPACKVGMAVHWHSALGDRREQLNRTLAAIRSGDFANYLQEQIEQGYPVLKDWRGAHSAALAEAEARLRKWLRPKELPPS